MTLAWYPSSQKSDFPLRQQQQQLRLLDKWWMWPTIIGDKERPANQAEDNLTAWELAVRFGKRTTIHGLDRLLVAHTSWLERVFWLATFIAGFLGAVFVCLIISRRYNAGHFQTVVDSTRYPVFRIPFPVVTICNLNRLNWQRMDDAKREFMPNENDTRKLQLFERIVAAYDDIAFGHFHSFSVLHNEPVAQLSHVNFSLVVEFMTWRCDEMLSDCVWRHFRYNCCEIFSLRRSMRGLCWAFNSLETDEGRRMQQRDSMWPWRTGSAGPTSALSLRVNIHPEKHFPNSTNEKGLYIMMTEPLVWHRSFYTVRTNTHTMVDIEPIIYFYDNDTRSVSSTQRECVFDDERDSQDFKSLQGYVYMIENCQAECHQEYLVHYCNCTIDLFFPPGQYRSCRAEDLLCLAKYNQNLQYSYAPGEANFVRNNYPGMVCKCFRNCYSLNYISDVRASYLPHEIYGNDSYVDLDVHFRFETMMVYRTSLVFGWVDLMVSFGGIAGLFLGCSLISGMELAYFLCIEVPIFIYKEFKAKWQQHSNGEKSTALKFINNKTNFEASLQNYYKSQTLQPKFKGQHIDKFKNWPRCDAVLANKHITNK